MSLTYDHVLKEVPIISKIRNGFMFMFQVMMHLWNYENLEKKVTLKERPKERPKETTTEKCFNNPSQNSDKKVSRPL